MSVLYRLCVWIESVGILGRIYAHYVC